MRTLTLKVFLVSIIVAFTMGHLWGQEIEPKAVAKLAAGGKIKFNQNRSITVWLDGNQKYTIEPVVTDNEKHTYRTASELGIEALPGGPRPLPPPPPINHTGPRPPLPIPPTPTNRRPTPQPPQKSLVQLAKEGAIVGHLQTQGISQSNWKLKEGSYTIILTTLDGKPVAVLVDSNGQQVVTFDNIFFSGAP